MTDVSRYIAALEAPELRVPREGWRRLVFWRGPDVVYRGRVLSHAEWLPFEERYREVRDRQAAGEDVTELLHDVFGDYLDAVGVPSSVVFQLPTVAVVAVMRDFLEAQTQAITPTTRKKAPTSGSASRSRGNGARLSSWKRKAARSRSRRT